LDTEPETRQSLVDHLEKFIIMDDVTLEDVTDTKAAIAVEGPEAKTVIENEIGRAPEESEHHLTADGVTVVAVSATGQPGYRLLTEAGSKDDLIGRLEAAGVSAASPEEARVVRVENGVPRHTEDFFETTLTQESGQMSCVSFEKGCYLGQEIVERVRARGEVKRQLVQIEVDAEEPPPAGSPVLSDGREIGTLTSPVLSHKMSACLGFSIARRDAVGPSHTLTVAGHTARVRIESEAV
jgi:aminomethyltransferase